MHLAGAGQQQQRPNSAAVAAAAAALVLQYPAAALAETAYFAGGNFSFLEKQFNDLKYAGVREVVPGFAGEERVEAVQVEYDAGRVSFESLVRTYWKYVDPTRADGQFSEKGPQFRSVIWVADGAQRAFVEDAKAKLERSGIFGKGPIVTAVLDAPPPAFEAAPAERLQMLKADPKALKKLEKSREAYFKDHWGYVQFCKDKVCGYVRFAPKCVGECIDVFPEYRERNSGVPELDASVKITKK